MSRLEPSMSWKDAHLGDAYRQMEHDLDVKRLKNCGDLWELDLGDPDKYPANELVTQILWQVESRVHVWPAKSSSSGFQGVRINGDHDGRHPSFAED